MSVTDMMRRSDSLYHDNISRRELCDMIVHLEYDNAELRLQLAESRSTVLGLKSLCSDMFEDFASADYELKRSAGRTFMAVTRYEPRLRELEVKNDA